MRRLRWILVAAALGLGVNLALDAATEQPHERSAAMIREEYAKRGLDVQVERCSTAECSVVFASGPAARCRTSLPLQCSRP